MGLRVFVSLLRVRKVRSALLDARVKLVSPEHQETPAFPVTPDHQDHHPM